MYCIKIKTISDKGDAIPGVSIFEITGNIGGAAYFPIPETGTVHKKGWTTEPTSIATSKPYTINYTCLGHNLVDHCSIFHSKISNTASVMRRFRTWKAYTSGFLWRWLVCSTNSFILLTNTPETYYTPYNSQILNYYYCKSCYLSYFLALIVSKRQIPNEHTYYNSQNIHPYLEHLFAAIHTSSTYIFISAEGAVMGLWNGLETTHVGMTEGTIIACEISPMTRAVRAVTIIHVSGHFRPRLLLSSIQVNSTRTKKRCFQALITTVDIPSLSTLRSGRPCNCRMSAW